MITQKDFLFYTNDFKELPYLTWKINIPPKAHIICENSFKNNIDIKKFINNLYTKDEIQNLIKTCFTFNEIIALKNFNKGFYVVSENRLSTLLKGIKRKFSSSICLLEINGEKILYFSNEYKFISFKPKIPAQSHINNINNFSNNKGFENNSFNNNILNKNFLGNNPFHNDMKLNMNNFNNIENHITNNNDLLNINNILNNIPTNNEININSSNLETNENKSKIIKSLILLYANEKEILRFYNQGIYDLKKYYLINKAWIDKYKEIYHYNEICKIPLINGINSLNDCSKILTLVNVMNEIKTIYNMINIDTYILQNISQDVETKIFGENNEFQYSENFVILNESIFNLLSQISSNIKIKDDYDINFGKLSLCLRNKIDLNKMYFYQYINKSFQISGMIELFADEWKYIYNKHFSKKTFAQYLTEKNINIGLIGQKQSLLSTANKLLGYIYLINKIGEHNKINENIISNNIVNTYKNENINISSKLNIIYQNFLQSLSSLPNNMNDFPNIETIMNYLSLNILNGVSVFIVENSTLNYCMNGEKKLMETDIISTDKISESIIYSFINDEICKYFSIQNIEILPKVFLFVNKDRYTKKRLIFIYYPNQNHLLNAINYKQNRFNLKKATNPDQNPYKMINNSFNDQQIFNRKSFNPNTKNNFIAVRFCSNDLSINYPIACKDSDIFIRLEEKLLMEYPELKNKNIFYTVNTNIINKTATLKQNGIERGDTIIINYDNEEEEKVIAIQFVSGDQNIHYPIACKETDIFLNIEKEFLDIYPFLRNKDIFYIANGNIIDRNATLKENRIKNGNSILINYD